MSEKVLILFFIAVIVRVTSLFISLKNERNLKLSGAIEYGRFNSKILMISHTFLYIFCFIEAYIQKTRFDVTTVIGFILLLFSIFILIAVIYQLKNLWTFKLYIAKEHYLNQSFIFRYFKHPNYFFNVIPELLALILICKAWLALIFLFPLHLIFLRVRINQENLAMQRKFARP